MHNNIIASRNAVIGALYRNILKPVLFLIDAEEIHESFIKIGSILGATGLGRACTRMLFGYKDHKLEQDILNIHFDNPIGLAAGFDYEGRLTGIMGSVGMGFSTIGTITNLPYEGNPKPRLARLVKSKSLLVNKGFKNLGVRATLEDLGKFSIPIGISIGKTNTLAIATQEQAVEDICSAFKEVERAGLPFSYYELNISCPNLQGNIEFYEPAHLDQLLKSVFALRLSKPVFIKMPIVKSNNETLTMIEVISKSPAAGIIIGNLQDDRNDPMVVREESERYPNGNLSGMPTQKRSNELIKLAYEKYGIKSARNGKSMIIIGCGGVFSAEDAYRKIRLGASLVQMITGMIFEGPQVISEINRGIGRFLARDGFADVSQAIGADI